MEVDSPVYQGKHAPVVMISYNRPDLLRMTMRNVALAHEIREHDVFMFIDGPRNEQDRSKQDEIEEIVYKHKKDISRLYVIRRDRNLGCRGNITDAITQIIDRYGRVVVVEDDILVSRTFFQYMDEALEFYEKDSRIWSINAYQQPALRVPGDYPHDVYLNPINMCWGWGTWKDRWHMVDFELTDWPERKKDVEFMRRLNHVSSTLPLMLDAQYEGKLKTWDVQCSYCTVKNGMMSVEPRYQLTKNIGHLPGGEHCGSTFPYITRQKYYNFRPRLIPDIPVDHRIQNQFRTINLAPSLIERGWRKIIRGLAYLKSLNMEPIDL